MRRLYAAAVLYLALLALSAAAGWKIARLQGKAAADGRAGTVQIETRTAEAADSGQTSLRDHRQPVGEATASPHVGAAAPGRQDTSLQAVSGARQRAILILVSLPSQRAYVFRSGVLWDSSPVSTGKRGKRTPTGTFTILEKQVHHRSTKYDDAPMPYMQRLTWSGLALHAGHLPGYPASHGCIRMPLAFAKRLYRVTDFDSTVVVVTARRINSPGDARKLS